MIYKGFYFMNLTNLKLIIFLILSIIFISCSKDKGDYVPVDSPKSFRVLGFCVPAPSDSLNSKYAIINKSIAESNFNYANINYYYRASKNLEDLLALNDINNLNDSISDIKEISIIENIEELANLKNMENIIIKDNSENKKVLLWNINNIYYSLLCNSIKEEDSNDIEKLALILIENKLMY